MGVEAVQRKSPREVARSIFTAYRSLPWQLKLAASAALIAAATVGTPSALAVAIIGRSIMGVMGAGSLYFTSHDYLIDKGWSEGSARFVGGALALIVGAVVADRISVLSGGGHLLFADAHAAPGTTSGALRGTYDEAGRAPARFSQGASLIGDESFNPPAQQLIDYYGNAMQDNIAHRSVLASFESEFIKGESACPHGLVDKYRLLSLQYDKMNGDLRNWVALQETYIRSGAIDPARLPQEIARMQAMIHAQDVKMNAILSQMKETMLQGLRFSELEAQGQYCT